jgi:hypothetical protein
MACVVTFKLVDPTTLRFPAIVRSPVEDSRDIRGVSLEFSQMNPLFTVFGIRVLNA